MELCVMKRNGALRRWLVVPAAAALLATGCNHMDDAATNYTRAIDTYYGSHASCLFEGPVKFPMEGDMADARETARYNALVDENLLTRSGGDKKMMVVASRQMSNYDLSPQGHAEWVADARQPGYGNLCYGHRKVLAIDSNNASTDGTTTTVVYRYTVNNVPSWAKAPALQAAFPGLRADLSGRQVGQVTLTNTKNGWEVTTAPWAHIEDSDIYR